MVVSVALTGSVGPVRESGQTTLRTNTSGLDAVDGDAPLSSCFWPCSDRFWARGHHTWCLATSHRPDNFFFFTNLDSTWMQHFRIQSRLVLHLSYDQSAVPSFEPGGPLHCRKVNDLRLPEEKLCRIDCSTALPNSASKLTIVAINGEGCKLLNKEC